MEKLPNLDTKWCGRKFIHLEEIGSTNDYLKSGDFPDGTVVIADRQTAGKGRSGKNWSGAPAGQALYLSVLFHSMKIDDMGLLPLLCGLAAAQSLGETAVIKWPNDLLLGEKKVCGILCESRIQGEQVLAVCGLGMNLGQPASFFEENGLPYATSLLAATGQSLPVLTVAAKLLGTLEPILDRYRKEGFAPFLQDYCDRCVTLKRQVRVILERETIQAKAVSVALDGSLICEKDGKSFLIRAGEASVRGLYGYV